MTTTVRWGPGRTAVVAVSGDLDDATAPRLGAVLDEVCWRQPTRISVDLGAVTFFSSSAVAALLGTRSRCPCDVNIVQAPPPVRRVMAILGLTLDLQAISH